MPYVNTKEMLKNAMKGNYAIGAFNAENMESVQAIVAAAEEMNSPVIIQTTPGSVRYAGFDYFVANVKAALKKAKVDVALHVDHGNSVDFCISGIESGYSSVMYDGSKLPFRDNVKNTKRVVEYAHSKNITVEAELGKLPGKEDDLEGSETSYTDPEEAKRFVKETGVDSLAIAIGTAHGLYHGTPVLNMNIISEVKKRIDIPLVLHGSSGLSDDCVMECIKRGMVKVNFATELRIAFSNAVKKYLSENPDVIDPKKYLLLAREAVKEQVKKRIVILGSSNKN